MQKKAQVLTVFLVVVLILALTSIVGISLISSKEISLSNFIKRAGDWFSSTISSLEYGLYSLNFQALPPENEITIPYFGEENLLPFFKAPFTITIYGEQVLPINYEGYFGFRDLFYPITWMFKWLVTRKEGSLVSLEINPSNVIELTGRYYITDDNTSTTDCSQIISFYNFINNLINFAYAYLQLEYLISCETTGLNDNQLSTYVLTGDNPNTNSFENYFITFVSDSMKYFDYVSLYINETNFTSPDSKVSIFYLDARGTFIEIASTTIKQQFINLPIKQNTNAIRIRVTPNISNNYALISEARFYGY